jgi:hypothetical protein
MDKFEEVRKQALQRWYTGLDRTRIEGSLSDDYSSSKWCVLQDDCTSQDKHCSFICSLGDWLDNISDLLHDERYDKLTRDNYEELFRHYTKILLIVSEILEDFIMLNKQIEKFSEKSKSSRDLEEGILEKNELNDITGFINSVCKHKTENNNLHVHNHHLLKEFQDFDDPFYDNQIRIRRLKLNNFDQDTSILLPKITYFLDVIIKINNKILDKIENKPDYKEKLFEIYSDEWHSS